MKINKNKLVSNQQLGKGNSQDEKLKGDKNVEISKKMHLQWIIRKVILGTGHTIPELKLMYSEENLFFIALKHVTTTKKSLCKALELNVDNCCRYKRSYESKGLLIESFDKHVCKWSGCEAKLLSTNPNKFDKLLMSNQYKLIFENGCN